MKPGGALNSLHLVEAGEQIARPSGLIVSGNAIAPLARRLAGRAAHYSSLRVTASRDRLIFWSVADEAPLPWIEEAPIYLTHMDKTLFFPTTQRPNLPAGWADPIIERLGAQKDLSRPILLMMSSDKLSAIGLGRNSRPVPAVDWEGFAGHDA
jgi:hypothetical protein